MTSVEPPNSAFNISTLDNGHFRLPPVIISYSDGSTSNLIIEVGDRLNSPNSSNNTNIRIDLNNTTTNNATASPTTLGHMLAAALNHHSRQLNNTPTPANTTTTSSLPSPPSNSDSTTASTTQQGIRGLDYPAFDTSRQGVYGSHQNSSSDSLDRLILPIQRALEERQRQRERLQHQSQEHEHQHQQQQQQQQQQHNPSSNADSGYGSILETTERSRNIILTVNYVYGQGPPQATTQNNNVDQPSLTGSLVLHIPSISESNDDNLQVLVRLATSIALRTIATSVKKAEGVSDETFNKLEVKHINDLLEADRQCAICYDNYELVKEDEEDEENKEIITKKRKRDSQDDDDDDQQQKQRAKLRKNHRGEAQQSSAPAASESKKPKNRPSHTVEETIYLHIPVTMPCGHTFGRSCLREWLKTNSSCPLCRDKIKSPSSQATRLENETTITLPNLASVISQSQLVIEDFNSRSMSFIMPDQDSDQNDMQAEELADPITLPIRLPNFSFPSTNINRNQDSNDNDGGGTTANASEVAGVLGVVRSLFDRLIGRQLRQRTNSDSLLNAPSLHALSDDENDNPDFGGLPTVNRSRDSGDTNVNAMEAQLARRRAIQRRANSFHPLSSPISTQASNDPLFPVGVESRRTADGVSTSLIGSTEASSTSTTSIDTPVNNDIVDNGNDEGNE